MYISVREELIFLLSFYPAYWALGGIQTTVKSWRENRNSLYCVDLWVFVIYNIFWKMSWKNVLHCIPIKTMMDVFSIYRLQASIGIAI
jgi:hypothetical protein